MTEPQQSPALSTPACPSAMMFRQRLGFFPINLFTITMGLGGLSIAWEKLAVVTRAAAPLGLLLGSLNSLVFLFLLGSYLYKWVLHRQRAAAEFQHPVLLHFFPAVSISLLLLSVFWQKNTSVALALWLGGAVMQLSLTLYVVVQWLSRSVFTLASSNPVWFIPVVGNIIAPITGSFLGYTDVSWLFFFIGLISWALLTVMLVFRLLYFAPLPPPLVPTLVIFLAPPSIGFVAYTALTGVLDIYAKGLFSIAVCIALALAVQTFRFARLPFSLSSWAYSFPLAALTIAFFQFAQLSGILFFWWIAILLLGVTTGIIAWLTLNTLRAYRCNKICVPEAPINTASQP